MLSLIRSLGLTTNNYVLSCGLVLWGYGAAREHIVIIYIGVATCSDLPGWEIDDQPLFDAMDRKGLEYSLAEWDDPDVDWAAFDGVLFERPGTIRSTIATFCSGFAMLAQRLASSTHQRPYCGMPTNPIFGT